MVILLICDLFFWWLVIAVIWFGDCHQVFSDFDNTDIHGDHCDSSHSVIIQWLGSWWFHLWFSGTSGGFADDGDFDGPDNDNVCS